MRKYIFFITLFLLFTNFTVIIEKVDFNDSKTKREKVNCVVNLFSHNGDYVLGSDLSKLIKDSREEIRIIQYFLGQNIDMVTYYDKKFWFKMKDGKDQYLTLFPTIKGVKVKFPVLIKHNASLEFIKTDKETIIIISGIKLFGFDLEKIVISDRIVSIYKFGTLIYQHI